jgi:UDP-N-acetylglucosamine--N-acetylmuramyl-(pentapeptide) pyrophosphoryl-undecaprenol N-acetylglucosamine transferase
LLGFSGALPKARYVGNPVRAEIGELAAPTQRFAARGGALRILVLGGSLGARVLNERVPQAVALMPATERPEVRHQCGARWQIETEQNYRLAGVAAQISSFINDMAAAYAWADVVICRAGALTVAEVVAAGLYPIFIPYPHAVDDHQSANARWLCQVGAAELVPEAKASPEKLHRILSALNRPELLIAAMKNRALAQPDCARQIAATALNLAAASHA